MLEPPIAMPIFASLCGLSPAKADTRGCSDPDICSMLIPFGVNGAGAFHRLQAQDRTGGRQALLVNTTADSTDFIAYGAVTFAAVTLSAVAPLPASGLLAFAALGALVSLRRRRG